MQIYCKTRGMEFECSSQKSSSRVCIQTSRDSSRRAGDRDGVTGTWSSASRRRTTNDKRRYKQLRNTRRRARNAELEEGRTYKGISVIDKSFSSTPPFAYLFIQSSILDHIPPHRSPTIGHWPRRHSNDSQKANDPVYDLLELR